MRTAGTPAGSPADELDDLFHGCALAAFLERAVAEGGWPNVEATRQLAYRNYERELAEKVRDEDQVVRAVAARCPRRAGPLTRREG